MMTLSATRNGGSDTFTTTQASSGYWRTVRAQPRPAHRGPFRVHQNR
jgi:hypothetical protein